MDSDSNTIQKGRCEEIGSVSFEHDPWGSQPIRVERDEHLWVMVALMRSEVWSAF